MCAQYETCGAELIDLCVSEKLSIFVIVDVSLVCNSLIDRVEGMSVRFVDHKIK